MTSVTNFEHNPDGSYATIEQNISGNDIPEGSTFVAFDSLAFARSTGQVAISEIKCDRVEGGNILSVENRDNRWLMWASIRDGKVNLTYRDLGLSMIAVLAERGVEIPDLSPDSLRVKQHIDVIRGVDYVGDGPMDLTSENQYEDSTLPAPYSDVELTPEGGLITAARTDLDLDI